MVLKFGVPAAVGGWISYVVLIYTNVEPFVDLPPEYEWVNQVVKLIPLIAGHHVLAWRIHTRDN